MKNIFNYCYFFLAFFLMVSCEDKIDVDLGTAPSKLVIDAAIQWRKGTAGNDQMIKLTTTAPYFSNTIPPASGASVFITNTANNAIYTFIENGTTGKYLCSNFVPTINGNYQLTVIFNGETFTASESLKSVPKIDKIEQENNTGFSGDDIQVKAFFTDNGSTNDFYLFQFSPSDRAIPNYGVSSDAFYQGNQIFGIYADENLQVGQNLAITFGGISQRYYTYMNKLLSLAGGSNGSPFQSPPATVRGNIINITNEKKFALGYFSCSEVDFVNYLVQ